nr:HVO_A0556 family zinc finger protein [Natronococcus occultus]
MTQLVLANLEEDRCHYCNGGALEVAAYKGNIAIVCDMCETPMAQFWDRTHAAVEDTDTNSG